MAELDLGKVTGEQGPQGIPGSQWYQGTAVTGEATSGTVFSDSGVLNAFVNDKYWNTDTNNVYTCVLGGASSTAKWAYVGNIQGDKGNTGPIGPTGNPGTAATIQVGEVTSGDVASVENTGTSTAAVFNFVLPKGDPGPQGPKGDKGDTGDNANITGAASSIVENNLSANRALISNGSGKVGVSGVTLTELGYLDGVTSGIQGQFNALNSKTSQFFFSSGNQMNVLFPIPYLDWGCGIVIANVNGYGNLIFNFEIKMGEVTKNRMVGELDIIDLKIQNGMLSMSAGVYSFRDAILIFA